MTDRQSPLAAVAGGQQEDVRLALEHTGDGGLGAPRQVVVAVGHDGAVVGGGDGGQDLFGGAR